MSEYGDLKIEGTLQGKILAMLVEGPLAGSDLMKKLHIRSPGTIYPVLKTLREKGLIEDAPERGPGAKKLYVLSEKGMLELKKILLGIGRGFYSRYLASLASDLVETLQTMNVTVSPKQKVLSTLLYQPIKNWLEKADATFLPIFEEITGTYDLILCGGAATLLAHGWRTTEFTRYLSNIIASLEPGGTLIILENEKTDNIFVNIFFQEALGFNRVTGLTKEELHALLETFNLQISTILSRRGVLLGIATKPRLK